MRELRAAILGAGLLIVAAPAGAVEPFVDIVWANANVGKAGVLFLDVRSGPAYMPAHIPGAVNAPHPGGPWRVTREGVGNVLPPLALAMYEVFGNKQAKLYENGISEWASDDNNPMLRYVALD